MSEMLLPRFSLQTKNLILPVICLLITSLTALSAAENPSVALTPERANHTATLLDSGKILIAGGVNESADLRSALLYEKALNTLTPTGSLITGRADHTATKLPDGRVLITGGDLSKGQQLRTAEFYDPLTGTFTQLATQMSTSRSKHTATLLPDGKVLIVGGKNAELCDPINQTFTILASVPLNRSSHSAVLLSDGTVLITGGYLGRQATAMAEIYNPATQTFTQLTNLMSVSRANHESTRLQDGRVLITGGFTGTSPQDEADLYNPATKIFTSTAPMNFHRSNHRGVLLPNGMVMIIGGTTLESGFLAVNEVFDPAIETWTNTARMNENRSGASATLLQDGTIFVAGGVTGSFTLQSAEILNPATRLFTQIADMTVARNQHSATLLPSGKVLLAGGSENATTLNSAELFDPVGNTFLALSSTLSEARKSHSATLLQDNARVLVAGGKTGDGDSIQADIYDISTRAFRRVGDMKTVRSLFPATLLPNGNVLLVGGRHGASPTKACDIFDPLTETFSSTGQLQLQRKRHRSTLLPNGTVLVSGGAPGSNGSTVPDSGTPTCEIYNPATGTFAYTSQEMNVGRTEHDATLLPDGTVLMTGGITVQNLADLYHPPSDSFTQVGSLDDERLRHVSILLSHPAWGNLLNKVLIIGGAAIGSGAFGGLEEALASVELFDPSTGQFSDFGEMTVPRQNQTATLLQDGQIMVAGGVSTPSFSGTGELLNASPTPTPTPAPVITAQPADKTVAIGKSARFTVAATGAPPLTYQWKKNGTDIAGATQASYKTPPATVGDDGSVFSVVVTNPGGSVMSDNATLMVKGPPMISSQPANTTVQLGRSAKFSVTATGATPLSYQWRKNGTNIAGATQRRYTTPPTTAADNGSRFSVIVSNSIGSETSTDAILTVQ